MNSPSETRARELAPQLRDVLLDFVEATQVVIDRFGTTHLTEQTFDAYRAALPLLKDAGVWPPPQEEEPRI